jgi:pimeloyl-ACP methyl ester carboxylesterase
LLLISNEILSLRTSDGLNLSARLLRRRRSGRSLTIQIPGFGQHNDTRIMRRCSEILSDFGDVLCLDLRGTGGSEGRYHFGAEEHRDVEAALDWAARHYPEIEMLGYSMGAYIALRAAAERPKLFKKLYLVSGPTCIEDIARTLGPIRQLGVLLRPELMSVRLWAGGNFFFRWGSVFRPKPRGEEMAKALKTPVSFLTGERDQLVLPKLSRRVYEAVPGKKLWTQFARGYHAEYLTVMREKEFRDWFEMSRAVLSRRK